MALAFYDDFSRASGPLELIGSGAGWQGSTGLWTTTAAGAASRSSGVAGTNAVAVLGTLDSDDQEVSAVLTRQGGSGNVGIIARANGSAVAFTGYNARLTGTGLYTLSKVIGGTTTNIGGPQTTGTYVAGDRITLRCVGTTISLLVNGVVLYSVTDTSVTTGRYVGMRAAGAGTAPWLDNFAAVVIGHVWNRWDGAAESPVPLDAVWDGAASRPVRAVERA